MISVVLATHNEANNLAHCLDAVKDLADEIVIADGESTDNTVAIAKKYGAKIVTTTNKVNFHINKQLAMDKAKGELVLQLDADEIVDTELKNFIEETHQKVLIQIKEQQLTIVAWWINRKNFLLGRWLSKGGQYPDPVIRLYVNGYAYLPHRDVHEQMTVDGEVGQAQGHLLHYGNPTFSEYLRKFNTYTTFKAHQLQAQHLSITLPNTINYCLIKPIVTWFSIYLRHRGYVDGFPGLVFATMSGLHHLIAYLKLWELLNFQKESTRQQK